DRRRRALAADELQARARLLTAGLHHAQAARSRAPDAAVRRRRGHRHRHRDDARLLRAGPLLAALPRALRREPVDDAVARRVALIRGTAGVPRARPGTARPESAG